MRRPAAALAVVVAGAVAAAGATLGSVRADPPEDVLAAAAGLPARAVSTLASAASADAERRLRDASPVPLRVTRDTRGLAHLVGTAPGRPLPLPLGRSGLAGPVEQARAHLERAGALFGLGDPAKELRWLPEHPGLGDRLGTDRIVRFQQLARGVPVLGGELVLVLDAAGALKSITGELAVHTEPVLPRVDADRARAIALAAVERTHPDARRSVLRSSAPELWHLDPALIGIPASRHVPAGPVWRLEVTDAGAIRELVLVDVEAGTIPLQLNLIAHLDRVVCDGANQPDDSELGADCTPTYARAEGQPAAAPPVDVDQAYENTGHAAEFFADYLGIDITALLGVNTGDGQRLRSTVRFCPGTTLCSVTAGTLFDNAFWNGRGMYYGKGWAAADDIVAHELTHGLTEKTARLLYLYQSGAISESISDIFGELVDLTNGVDGLGLQPQWAMGEDAPLDQLPLRNLADPTATLLPIFGQPDRMTAPTYAQDVFFVDNGGVHDNSGVGNKAGYLIAVGTGTGSFNGQFISGIGLRRTAVLHYRALRMLTSGSDYADLGGALNQACANLVGTEGFTATHCEQVRRAVLATEMALQPPGAAAAPEVGFCPPGTRRATVFSDGFEKFSTKTWSLGGQWLLINDYARSGVQSIYGVEPDRALSSAAVLRDAVRLPRGVRVFLRFDHQYRLDHGLLETGVIDRYYDGALVEVRVGSGSWVSTSLRSWVNGPNAEVNPDPGPRYRAFGGDSYGYTSSRLDLGYLAGKAVKFRWLVVGDSSVAFDGWTVDNVSIDACGTTTPSDPRDLRVQRKKGTKATLTWKPPVYRPVGGLSRYKVTRLKGGGLTTQVKYVEPGKRKASFIVKKGKSYKFAVKAEGSGGQSPATKAKLPK